MLFYLLEKVQFLVKVQIYDVFVFLKIGGTRACISLTLLREKHVKQTSVYTQNLFV